MMKKLVMGTAAVMALAVGMNMSANADSHANVSQERVQLMKDIGKLLRGGSAADVEAKYTMLKSEDLWPVGVLGTRGKDNIWEGDAMAPGFVAILDEGLAAAAAGDLQAVGKTCGTCHKDYRGPKP